MGLADTACTNDQLDMLALCPAGYIADYAYCTCNPSTAATAMPPLGACPSGYVSNGSQCVPGALGIPGLTPANALTALGTTLSGYWPWLAGGLVLYLMMGKR